MTAGKKRAVKRQKTTAANLGFEAQLWAAANALRGSMDAAEYKHVVLGLIFLKYISDAFEAHHAKLEAERDQGADPEDRDEYRAEGIFWVPPEARWSELQKNARQPTIGLLVDQAMAAVERDNPSLKGVLPKDYARPALDKQRLGQLIDLVTNIHLGGGDNHARDILGRVYEYFLGQFASAEGKKGRRVLHPPLHRQAPGRDAPAVPGAGLRPLLRFRGDVRSVGRVHRGPWRTDRGHLHLRPGAQLHHLAPVQDEPGHPGDRGPDRTG
ncbi:MAG: hypothetical protein KatS3mg082_3046 [Nitrospiraceae bacterium]|nr:MAG: hypothetical protein KatS3mg082_3046 [Nitrospiraceae bacterium]